MNFSRIHRTTAGLMAALFLWAMPMTGLADNGPSNISALVEKTSPGVVNIRTVQAVDGGRVFRHFFGNPGQGGPENPFQEFMDRFHGGRSFRDFKRQSLGSGFILDREGHIVTNNHVIDGATGITVRLSDGREFDAEVVGRDSKTDLALIRIAPSSDLSPLPLGDSDALKVGDWVAAIGSPFGLDRTVTVGIVSAKGRAIGAGPYDDFLQTDASINPGNSGGPLLDMDGRVVGINTAIIASGQGIGFAIPIALAGGIIDQLKKDGVVSRGWLGVGIQDLTPELREYYGVKEDRGVLVSQVNEGQPADLGGIEPGDIITEVDGREVSSSRELSRRIAAMNAGGEAKIGLLRKGKPHTLTVKLGNRADDEARNGSPGPRRPGESGPLGMALSNITPDIARRFGLEEGVSGVVVTGVDGDGKAAKAGLSPGDVILEINREPVKDVDTLVKDLKKAPAGETIRLLVNRARSGIVVISLTV